MHLALTDRFQAKWTAAIHDEWIRNVLASRPDLSLEQLERTRQLMDKHVRDALVEGYESLIEHILLPDPDDRHILAAAVTCRADVIVTFNLKDFPPAALLPYGIEAQHPDLFITSLLEFDPAPICSAVKRHRQSLRNPPKNVADYLATLERQGLPQFTRQLRRFAFLI